MGQTVPIWPSAKSPTKWGSDMVKFKDIAKGSFIVTRCGQRYKKINSRMLEMAPGHSHYNPDHVKKFYATMNEYFRVEA